MIALHSQEKRNRWLLLRLQVAVLLRPETRSRHRLHRNPHCSTFPVRRIGSKQVVICPIIPTR